MSQNAQTPFLFTITSGQTLTITFARSVSVLASGGTATITNVSPQSMTIPDGTTVEITADTGNTFTNLIITASATAYVVMLGGNGTIT